MPVRVIFRCEHCDAAPDPETQRALERQLRDRTFGEFLDAQPGGWLVWTGGGPLGAKRYACVEHRAELVAHLRLLFGTRRCGVNADEPYPALWPRGLSGFDERELAALLHGTLRLRA